MKQNFIISTIIVALAAIVCSCSDSPYDKAVSYIDELTAEVMSATTEAEFDKVYNKIITINSNEVMTDLTDISQEQKQVIAQKMVDLTYKSLSIKAILSVMPENITPTSTDMAKLADECAEKNLNVLNVPYAEVKAMVHDYYHIDK